MSSSKKSSKGDSAAEKTYNAGDIVLSKVKGYPSWPSQVLDHSMAPPAVAKSKPGKGKATYLVRFFPTGDYAWTASRDISALSPKEITAYIESPHKKNGELLEGYKVAQDPTEWQRAKDEAADMDTEDQLASDGGEPKADGKKRKRPSETKGKEKKAAVVKEKKPAAAAAGKTKATKKSGAVVQSEDEAPPSKKSKAAASNDDEDPGAKQVKDWRHKLQRTFLSKDGGVAAAEVPKCKEMFEAMEDFDMHPDWLAESKLGKVLKRIGALVDGQIPGDDGFDFAGRANRLVKKWNALGGGEKADSEKPATPVPAAEAPKSEANGSSEKKENGSEEKVEESPAAEEALAPAAAEAVPAAEEEKKDEEAKAPAEEEMKVDEQNGEKVEEKKEEAVESAPMDVDAAPAADAPAAKED